MMLQINEVIVTDEKRETKEVMVTVDMNTDSTDCKCDQSCSSKR